MSRHKGPSVEGYKKFYKSFLFLDLYLFYIDYVDSSQLVAARVAMKVSELTRNVGL